MRIGSVTHRGYGELVLGPLRALWGWFAAGDLVLTNLVTLVAEFVAIRVGLAYFGLGSGVAVGARARRWCCFTLVGRSLLALGADRARAGRVQRPVPARRRARQSALGGDRPCVRHLGPVPRRVVQHPAAAARLDDRRDRDAVDDLLPAERLGRQGDDARATSPTAGSTPRSARCWRRLFGCGALIAGAALATPWRRLRRRGWPAPASRTR